MRDTWTWGAIVALAIGSVADASPRTPTFKDISRARILGLTVDDIDVQTDGSLRIRARIEVDCASLKAVKPVDGRCFVAFPRKQTESYLLDVRLNDHPNSLGFAISPIAENEFAIRSDDLMPLELLAAGSAAGSWTFDLTLVSGKPTASTNNRDPGGFDAISYVPPWVTTAKSVDEFAAFEADGIPRAWCAMEHHVCEVGGFEGDMTSPDIIDVQLPTGWIDHAGKLMLSRRRPELLKRYRELASKNALGFVSRLLEEQARLKEFKVEDANGDLDGLMKELPQIVADRISRLELLPPSLERSSKLYEEVARINNAFATQLPADVLSKLSTPELDALVRADIAAFVAHPVFPTKAEKLSEWPDVHEALLFDSRFPEVLVLLGEERVAQKEFPAIPPLADGGFDAVIAAALRNDDLRDRLVAIVRSDIELSFAKDPQTTCTGDPVEVYAGAIHMFRIGKDRVLASPAGKQLALRVAEAMVSAKQFSAKAAETFIALVPETFEEDPAGQSLALRVSTRIEERRRVARQEQIKLLISRQAELSKLCKQSVASAIAQESAFKKRARVMGVKEVQQRRSDYERTAKQISFLQSEFRSVVDGMQKLGAQPEATKAQSDLAACKVTHP